MNSKSNLPRTNLEVASRSLTVNGPCCLKCGEFWYDSVIHVTIACFRRGEVGAVTVPRGPSGSAPGTHHGRLQGKTQRFVLVDTVMRTVKVCLHCPTPETGTDTEIDTDTDKLTQNPIGICVGVCLCAL